MNSHVPSTGSFKKEVKVPKFVLLDPEPSLLISKEVNDRIKYLCSKINNVEWSGILLYTAKGDLSDIDSIEMEVKDVFLMDIGSSAHTSFEYDPVVISNAFLNNPTWMEEGYRIGLIHSHVNFGVFFSGTDMSELSDNAENYDFYLSLITNNANDFTAKIAFAGKEKSKSTKTFSLLNLLSGNFSITPKEEEKEEEVIFTCDVFIEVPDGEKVLYVDYDLRIEEIKKAKEAKRLSNISRAYPTSSYPSKGHSTKRDWRTEPINMPVQKTFWDEDDVFTSYPKTTPNPHIIVPTTSSINRKDPTFSKPTYNNTYSIEELEFFFKYLLLGEDASMEEAKRKNLTTILEELHNKIPKDPDVLEEYFTKLVKESIKDDKENLFISKFVEVYKIETSEGEERDLSVVLDNFAQEFYEYFSEYLYSPATITSEYHDWLVEMDNVLFNIAD